MGRTIFALGCYAIFMVLVFTGIVDFAAWPQVTDLHDSRVSLGDLYGHPHFFRYLVALPGLLLSDRFGEVGFSFYIANFTMLSTFIMYAMLRGRSTALVAVTCIIIVLIHVFMNGRGAISWMGWMIILWVMFAKRQPPWQLLLPLIAFALLCCSVSSGIFSVAFGAVLTFMVLSIHRGVIARNFLIMGAMMYLYSGLFMEGIERNLAYYSLGTGNPIIHMATHGAGVIVMDNTVVFISVVVIVLILCSYIWFSLREKPRRNELIAILTPIAGGVFGYTTLTLVVPSILLVLSRRLGSGALPQVRTAQ